MDFSTFKWLNKTEIATKGDQIAIYAPEFSNYFNDPIPEHGRFPGPHGDAPFFYKEMDGDFVIQAKLRPNFQSTYDAACLMVIQNDSMWIKAAFERSDFNTNAVVSVVTNIISDDANGCNIDADSVWLQIARVGNNFAIHYSLDGQKYDMVRVFYLPIEKTVKVGIEAQCPTGEGGYRYFSNLLIEKRTVANLRAGR